MITILDDDAKRLPPDDGRRVLLVALFACDAAELLPDAVDVPTVLPTTAGAARRSEVGDDLAGGDVALD